KSSGPLSGTGPLEQRSLIKSGPRAWGRDVRLAWFRPGRSHWPVASSRPGTDAVGRTTRGGPLSSSNEAVGLVVADGVSRGHAVQNVREHLDAADHPGSRTVEVGRAVHHPDLAGAALPVARFRLGHGPVRAESAGHQK